MPVYAGTYEDALSKSDKVFLYFYTPNCSSCRYFDKTYNELKATNKDYEFVKVNANTLYGAHLINKYKGKYVPYIILTNSKTNKSVNVNHLCLMEQVCLTRALKSFN